MWKAFWDTIRELVVDAAWKVAVYLLLWAVFGFVAGLWSGGVSHAIPGAGMAVIVGIVLWILYEFVLT